VVLRIFSINLWRYIKSKRATRLSSLLIWSWYVTPFALAVLPASTRRRCLLRTVTPTRMFSKLGTVCIVMQAPPSISEAFKSCIDQGATTVVLSPYFLSPGRHWNEVCSPKLLNFKTEEDVCLDSRQPSCFHLFFAAATCLDFGQSVTCNFMTHNSSIIQVSERMKYAANFCRTFRS
jgi:hypothetical protein